MSTSVLDPRDGITTFAHDLLRISVGAIDGDLEAWRAHVLATCARYDAPLIDRGFDELVKQGFITNDGLPGTGWLTPKGRAALREALMVNVTERACELPRLTFEEFNLTVQREYWSAVLAETRGNIRLAARRAGLSRSGTIYQLDRLGLRTTDASRQPA